MALTAVQKRILQVIAANRSPNSVFGGGSVLNRDRPRQSRDFDIEHGSADAVRQSFAADRTALIAVGYAVEETGHSRPQSGFVQAIVRAVDGSTLIDWIWDSAVRFYPAIKDDEFGWRLHDIDLAVNKLLAMAGRREPRDYFDVIALHRSGLHLAIPAWAACGKDPGMVPDLVLDEITRNSNYPTEQIQSAIMVDQSIDVVAMKRDLLQAVAEARDLFATLPRSQAGHLYVDASGEAQMPNAERIDSGTLRLHSATVGGAWPSVADPNGSV
jgi:hypothetical protein